MKHPAFCKILQQYVWQLFGGMQCLVCGCQCLVVVAAGYAQYRFLGIFMFVLFWWYFNDICFVWWYFNEIDAGSYQNDILFVLKAQKLFSDSFVGSALKVFWVYYSFLRSKSCKCYEMRKKSKWSWKSYRSINITIKRTTALQF